MCSNSDITTSKSENTAVNVCFSVESGCSDPVKSLPLRFEILSGDGLDLFRLENTTTSGNNIGLCTKASLKNKYGEWTVSRNRYCFIEIVIAILIFGLFKGGRFYGLLLPFMYITTILKPGVPHKKVSNTSQANVFILFS